jgi:hypothetical protein
VEEVWKSVELYVPARLRGDEITGYLDAQIRSIAHDTGEFIQQIKVVASAEHCDQWRKLSASYLCGPPQAFRR